MDDETPPGRGAKEPPDPLLGALLAGRYRLDRCVGTGSMGRVYQARDQQTSRQVAIKILAPEHANNPEVIARFDRELRATTRIDHPNVVRVFEHGTAPDGTLYLVLEYLEGRSLDRIILTEAPLAAPRVARIVRQIGRALQAAHARNIVHRDLKPENVMLVERHGETDIVKILDFGLAQLLDEMTGSNELTMNGSRVGTPHYMAPEYVGGFAYDSRSDLYALGVLAFEMCTGRTPFLGTPSQIFEQQVESAAPTLRQLRGDAPEALATLVDRLLSRDPERRPQHAGEVVAALATLASLDLPPLPADASTEDRVRRSATNSLDLPPGMDEVSPGAASTPTLPAGRSVAAKVRRGTTDAPSKPPEDLPPNLALTTLETLRDSGGAEPGIRDTLTGVRDTLKMAVPAVTPRRPVRVVAAPFPPPWLDGQLLASGCLGVLTLGLATVLFVSALLFFLSTR